MDGELTGTNANTSIGGIDGNQDASPTGLAYLLVPASHAYQAILDVLAAEPDRPRTASEVAAELREPVATVDPRLTDLVGWGNVRRFAAPDSLAGYRAGPGGFALTELGVRVWRAVTRTTVDQVAEPVAAPFDPAELLRLARRFDEASDAEAASLYAEAFGVPVPQPTPRPSLVEHVAPDLSEARHVLLDRAATRARVRHDAALELRRTATDLARQRLTSDAFRLLMELLGRAIATAAPEGDAYVADTSLRLELHLLYAPGTSTPLYGDDGVITLDGFKVRLSALDAEHEGGAR